MRIAPFLLACALPLAACTGSDEGAASGDSVTPGADSAMAPGGMAGDTGAMGGAAATAALRDSAGHDLGTLTLADASGGVSVSGTLRGLPPGTHAIHIHTTGSCEAPGFTSAGGHWNPTSKQHGSQNPQGPHFGDMPNITVAADSTVTVQATTPGGSLHGENALLDADGAAVMIHMGEDDYRSDPAGNAGSRIACGTVQGG